jgi:hypothetical protein
MKNSVILFVVILLVILFYVNTSGYVSRALSMYETPTPTENPLIMLMNQYKETSGDLGNGTLNAV